MHTIYTVGYSGWTPAQLQETATRLDAVVVDIRLSPTSRRPEWRSDALARLLRDRYEVLSDLGNVNYRVSEPIVLANPGPGVVVARSLLRRRNIILLCACRDHALCHRNVAAQLISEATGDAVVHLEPPTDGVIPALTITQPYATLVSINAKLIETRGWATKYRGPIAIHAAQGLGPVGGKQAFAYLCHMTPFFEALRNEMQVVMQTNGQQWPHFDPERLPRGAVVAIARLSGVYRIIEGGQVEGFHPQPLARELAFGDYSPGRFAWLLADIRRLPVPIPAKGAQGLWRWDVPEGVEV